jgi:hypothetical protein
MVAACLVALVSDRHVEAAKTLRALAGQSKPNSRSAHRGQ